MGTQTHSSPVNIMQERGTQRGQVQVLFHVGRAAHGQDYRGHVFIRHYKHCQARNPKQEIP